MQRGCGGFEGEIEKEVPAMTYDKYDVLLGSLVITLIALGIRLIVWFVAEMVR